MNTNPAADIPAGTEYIGDIPADVLLAALYNSAIVKGMGTRTPIDGKMSIVQAKSIVMDRNRATHIEELYGRFIGLDLTLDHFDPAPYDEANLKNTDFSASDIIGLVRAQIKEAIEAAIKDHWARTDRIDDCAPIPPSANNDLHQWEGDKPHHWDHDLMLGSEHRSDIIEPIG